MVMDWLYPPLRSVSLAVQRHSLVETLGMSMCRGSRSRVVRRQQTLAFTPAHQFEWALCKRAWVGLPLPGIYHVHTQHSYSRAGKHREVRWLQKAIKRT